MCQLWFKILYRIFLFGFTCQSNICMPSMVQLWKISIIDYFNWLRIWTNQRVCMNLKPHLIQFSSFSMVTPPNSSCLQYDLLKHHTLVQLLSFQLLANQKHHSIWIQSLVAVVAHLVVLGTRHLLKKGYSLMLRRWNFKWFWIYDFHLRLHCSYVGKSSSWWLSPGLSGLSAK